MKSYRAIFIPQDSADEEVICNHMGLHHGVFKMDKQCTVSFCSVAV